MQSPSSPWLWLGGAAALLGVGAAGEAAFFASLDYNAAFLTPGCTGMCWPDFTFTTGGFIGLLLALVTLPAGAFVLAAFNMRTVKHEAWHLRSRGVLFGAEAAVCLAIASWLVAAKVRPERFGDGYAYKQGFLYPGGPSNIEFCTQTETQASNWWCLDNSVRRGPQDDDGAHEQHNAALLTHAATGAFVALAFGIWSLALCTHCLAREGKARRGTNTGGVGGEPLVPLDGGSGGVSAAAPLLPPAKGSGSSLAHTKRWRRTKDLLALSLVFALLFPLLALFSAMLPNNFWRFTPPQILYYLDMSRTELNTGGNPGSVTGVSPWGGFEFEVYPDVLAYYIVLYAVSLCAIVARFFPSARRVLHTRFAVPAMRLGWTRTDKSIPTAGPKMLWHTLCVGEALVLAAFAALAIWWLHYWAVVHVFPAGNSTSGNAFPDEIAARAAGNLANLLLALTFLPAARNSVWVAVFGVPFERAIRFHRMLGRLFMVTCTVHQFLFWGVFRTNDKFCDATQTCLVPAGQTPAQATAAGCIPVPSPVPANASIVEKYYLDPSCATSDAAAWCPAPCDFPKVMFQIENRPYHPDNFTIPLMFWLWCGAVVATILAIDFVRRKHFEVFMFCHHFLFTSFVLGALMHAASLWYLLLGSLVLWACDRALRARSAAVWANVTSVKVLAAGVTELTIDCGTFEYTVGQYAFLNVPAISTLQWHPFSISSAPTDASLTFHIKDMGTSTFTGRLHELAAELGKQQPESGAAAAPGHSLGLSIDGPFGNTLVAHEYSELLLIGGGIGITPLHCMYRELAASDAKARPATVHLHWVAQDSSMLENFAASLATEADGFRVSMYTTREPPGAKARAFDFETSRPNVRDIIEQRKHAVDAEHGRLAVVVCGPAAMVSIASEATRAHGVAFHAETFEL